MKVKFVKAFSSTIKVKGIEIRNGEILVKLSNKQREEWQNVLIPLGFKCYYVNPFYNIWLHEDGSYFDRIIIGDVEN